MSDSLVPEESRLTTPRAAAVAGIVFSVLFMISVGILRLAVPSEVGGLAQNTWLITDLRNVRLSLSLLPFAGIAFLWFMGVVRSHLGSREDQFFSTVFRGSGLLFLAMVFVSAVVADGLIRTYLLFPDDAATSEVLAFARSIAYTSTNVYAVRMAGVFMFSLGTVWMRTRTMPRIITVVTYVLALALLLIIGESLWAIMVFPLWVLAISVYILIETMRRRDVKT